MQTRELLQKSVIKIHSEDLCSSARAHKSNPIKINEWTCVQWLQSMPIFIQMRLEPNVYLCVSCVVHIHVCMCALLWVYSLCVLPASSRTELTFFPTGKHELNICTYYVSVNRTSNSSTHELIRCHINIKNHHQQFTYIYNFLLHLFHIFLLFLFSLSRSNFFLCECVCVHFPVIFHWKSIRDVYCAVIGRAFRAEKNAMCT